MAEKEFSISEDLSAGVNKLNIHSDFSPLFVAILNVFVHFFSKTHMEMLKSCIIGSGGQFSASFMHFMFIFTSIFVFLVD